MENKESNIIIYNTIDGKASVVLYARDGSVWMNQNQFRNFLTPLSKILVITLLIY